MVKVCKNKLVHIPFLHVCCTGRRSPAAFQDRDPCYTIITYLASLYAKQDAEMSSCSSKTDMSMQMKLPTASLTQPGPPKQPEHSKHGLHDRHCTQSAAGPLTDTQTHMGHGATPRPSLRQATAAQAHAGHAGLLRFKRQWPMPRSLMLSDSDSDSDSLSEFDSIVDFHVEHAADQKLAQQHSRCQAVEPGSQAVCLSSSGGRHCIANSSKVIGAGQSMQTNNVSKLIAVIRAGCCGRVGLRIWLILSWEATLSVLFDPFLVYAHNPTCNCLRSHCLACSRL